MRQALECCRKGWGVSVIIGVAGAGWYMEGRIHIDDLITHRLALPDINRGFDLMHAGESIRSVVVY